jgi:hypothetical protein
MNTTSQVLATLPPVPLLHAQQTSEPVRSKPALAREATGLWGTLVLWVVIILTVLAVIMLMRRAARLRAIANRTPIATPIVDAWAESAKRISPDEPYLHGPERSPSNPPPDTPDTRGNYQPPARP